MTSGSSIEGVLVQWGERLFYPASRIVKPAPTLRLDTMTRRKAAVIRQRIEATVVRRAPQVMVKLTGGGRGMAAIAAHLRYISKNGRPDIEDDRGVVRDGKEALHEHQANPHVHLSVRAESMRGERLNPCKADLHRWRETFAEKLRGWGVDAEATRQTTRGATRNFDPIWRVKAKQEGRLRGSGTQAKSGDRYQRGRNGALEAWAHIAQALKASGATQDQTLAENITRFVRESAYLQEVARHQRREAAPVNRERQAPMQPSNVSKSRSAPDIER